jgi:hypothetical protein
MRSHMAQQVDIVELYLWGQNSGKTVMAKDLTRQSSFFVGILHSVCSKSITSPAPHRFDRSLTSYTSITIKKDNEPKTRMRIKYPMMSLA